MKMDIIAILIGYSATPVIKRMIAVDVADDCTLSLTNPRISGKFSRYYRGEYNGTIIYYLYNNKRNKHTSKFIICPIYNIFGGSYCKNTNPNKFFVYEDETISINSYILDQRKFHHILLYKWNDEYNNEPIATTIYFQKVGLRINYNNHNKPELEYKWQNIKIIYNGRFIIERNNKILISIVLVFNNEVISTISDTYNDGATMIEMDTNNNVHVYYHSGKLLAAFRVKYNRRSFCSGYYTVIPDSLRVYTPFRRLI